MDSASSSLPLATRDGSPEAAATAEEDSTLTVVAGLAKEAALLFQAGKFVECLRILHQLSHKKGDDPRVIFSILTSKFWLHMFWFLSEFMYLTFDLHSSRFYLNN